jgi:hypothetical protein
MPFCFARGLHGREPRLQQCPRGAVSGADPPGQCRAEILRRSQSANPLRAVDAFGRWFYGTTGRGPRGPATCTNQGVADLKPTRSALTCQSLAAMLVS